MEKLHYSNLCRHISSQGVSTLCSCRSLRLRSMQFSSDAMLRKPLLCYAFALPGLSPPRLRAAIAVQCWSVPCRCLSSPIFSRLCVCISMRHIAVLLQFAVVHIGSVPLLITAFRRFACLRCAPAMCPAQTVSRPAPCTGNTWLP